MRVFSKRQKKSEQNVPSNSSTEKVKSWVYSKGRLKILSALTIVFSMVLIISVAADESSPNSSLETSIVINDEADVPVAGVVSVLGDCLKDNYVTQEEHDSISLVKDIERPFGSKLMSVNVYAAELPEVEKVEEKPEPTVNDYSFDKTGYTTSKLNVRVKPDVDSESLEVLGYSAKIQYDTLDDNEEWFVINKDGNLAYVYAKYVSDEKPQYRSIEVWGDTRKSYMDHASITNVSSPQWKIKQMAYTEWNGLRVVEGRYLIAVGSYYTHNVGQYVDVVLANGTVIPCIVGDCKRDCDTTNNHSLGVDGGAVEFIVQTSSLNQKCRNMGDVSFADDSWNSNVVELRIYEKDIVEKV